MSERTSALEAIISAGPLKWGVFGAVTGALLLVDVAHARTGRVSTLRSAAVWSAIWIGVGLIFGGWVWMRFGEAAGLAYLTAYLIE